MCEVYHCELCGAETGFVINGAGYCPDHTIEGVGIQARLVASLGGRDSEGVRHLGEWAQDEIASMLGLPRE
jgi:hypothetical protein